MSTDDLRLMHVSWLGLSEQDRFREADVGDVLATASPGASATLRAFLPSPLREIVINEPASLEVQIASASPGFVVGGAVVRALLGLPMDHADCDVYSPQGLSANRIRERFAALADAPFGPLGDCPALDPGWHVERYGSDGHPLFAVGLPGRQLKIDVIDPSPLNLLDLRGFLDRFDVNLCRCAWDPLSQMFLFADLSVANDLAARRVVMRDVAWTRPHREAKYRVLLGLGPRPDVVLPYLPPHGAPVPEGFRALTDAEQEAVKGPPGQGEVSSGEV